MSVFRTIIWVSILFLGPICSVNAGMRMLNAEESQQIQQRQHIWKAGITRNNLKQIMSVYSEQVILMPEYQPTLNGRERVEAYYKTLSKRRAVKQLSLSSEERFEIDGYIFDIGQFDMTIDWKKGWTAQKETLVGKYWQTWKASEDGEFVIVGDAFGFYQRYERPERWVTHPRSKKDPSPTGFRASEVSIELKAYAALGVRGVMHKDGELRAQLYADDAVFYPYANTPKRGIEVLRPYLIQYANHDARMDWLQTHTHDVVYLGGYIYEMTKFAVGWTHDGKSEQSHGKGMRIWKRQNNGQLRIYRHFGTHNH